MTGIAIPFFKSKKAFKEAMVSEERDNIYVCLPNPVTPFSNTTFTLDEIKQMVLDGDIVTITNHPKRSWYGQFKVMKSGKNKGKMVLK